MFLPENRAGISTAKPHKPIKDVRWFEHGLEQLTAQLFPAFELRTGRSVCSLNNLGR